MYFHGGTRKTRNHVGFAAEFCEACRQPRAFSIFRLGMGEHAYGIFLGSQELSGYVGTCQACENERTVNPLHFSNLAPHLSYDLDGLINETFPNFRRVYAQRLMLEEQLRSGQLAPVDREILCNEIFLRFAFATERLLGVGIQVGKRGGWGCLGAFVIAFAVAIIGNMLWLLPEQREYVITAAVCVFLIGVTYSVREMLREPKRLFARKIVPELAAALRHISPTRRDISNSFEKTKRLNFRLASRIDPEALWAHIHYDKRPP